MINDIKELTFDVNDVTTLLFDNGLMLTIDFVPETKDVAEGYITRATNVNGVCLETKYWSKDDTVTTYINFVEGLSIEDKSFESSLNK